MNSREKNFKFFPDNIVRLGFPPALYSLGRPAAVWGTSLCSGPAGSGRPWLSGPHTVYPHRRSAAPAPLHSRHCSLWEGGWHLTSVVPWKPRRINTSVFMWLTVDLVDVALDFCLREELVVDVSLRIGILHLLLEQSDKKYSEQKLTLTLNIITGFLQDSTENQISLQGTFAVLRSLSAKHISSHPVTQHTSYMDPSLNLWEEDGVILFLSPFFTVVISVASVVWAVSAFYCLMPKCSSASGRMSNYFTNEKVNNL